MEEEQLKKALIAIQLVIVLIIGILLIICGMVIFGIDGENIIYWPLVAPGIALIFIDSIISIRYLLKK